MAQFQRREFSPPVFDQDAIDRADEALLAMAGSFREWLESEVQRLQDARIAGEAAGWDDAAIEALFFRAHDLKGLGGTYGYPLVTQIAASLCRLIYGPEAREIARVMPGLIGAHVDALRASVRDGVQADSDPIGGALLKVLNAKVAALGIPQR